MSTESTEQATVIAIRCNDLSDPVMGATQRKCSRCDENVWASKSSTDLESRFEVKYVCTVCEPPSLARQRPNLGIAPGSREELEGHLGVWAASAILKKLGVKEL